MVIISAYWTMFNSQKFPDAKFLHGGVFYDEAVTGWREH